MIDKNCQQCYIFKSSENVGYKIRFVIYFIFQTEIEIEYFFFFFLAFMTHLWPHKMLFFLLIWSFLLFLEITAFCCRSLQVFWYLLYSNTVFQIISSLIEGPNRKTSQMCVVWGASRNQVVKCSSRWFQ